MDGLAWLDKNWSVTENVGPCQHSGGDLKAFWLYYMYALERAGILVGAERIGGRDWYREGAKEIVAAGGYPMDPRKGDVIHGLPKDSDDAVVFHAGTAPHEGQTVTSGGRVLCVTALASTVKAAQMHAYDLLRGIHFEGAQYRRAAFQGNFPLRRAATHQYSDFAEGLGIVTTLLHSNSPMMRTSGSSLTPCFCCTCSCT